MLENSLAMLVKNLDEEIVRVINSHLRAYDLTMRGIWVLFLLLDTPQGALKSKEIERALSISQPTCFGILSRLENKGFIVSSVSKDDRRARTIEITDKGRNAANIAIDGNESIEDSFLSGFSEEEKQLLFNMLERLIKNAGKTD